MKKTITVLTATRAEYGLLRPIIKALKESGNFDIKVVVTGAHLSPEFGLTYQEIINDGIEIDQKIEILLSSDTPVSISKSMGLAMISFSEYFEQKPTDALMVLGDRYETLAVALAAMNARIPIIHLYGGETTEGAIDEAIRHAITKLSYLHFTSAAEYRTRVIQLGEHPDRVFAVGGIGIENALKMPLLSKEELEKSIDFRLDKPYAVVTFHPVTLEDGMAQKQFQAILEAFDAHPEMLFIITKANADANGRIINKMIDEYAASHENVAAFESLGALRYLSALKYADMVIGNSSSGLVEVPSFHIPTVNIGDRQRGRLMADSVICCEPVKEDVLLAMEQADSKAFREKLADVKNPYGDGDTSRKIVDVLNRVFLTQEIDLKKVFYDIPIEV